MSQRYIHCEWTISVIPIMTPVSQLSSVLQDYFSTRCCSWMSRHALSTYPSILFSHPILSCAIADLMKFSVLISSSWNHTCPFPLTNVKKGRWWFGCVSRLASFLENCITSSSKNSFLFFSDKYNWLHVSSFNNNVMQHGHSASVAITHLCSIFSSRTIY